MFKGWKERKVAQCDDLNGVETARVRGHSSLRTAL